MTLDAVAVAARNQAIRNRALLEAQAFVRSHIFALEDRTADELRGLLEIAYNQLSRQLDDVWLRYGVGETWNASDVLFRQRTEYLLDQYRQEIANLTDAIANQTLDAMIGGYRGGYYGSAWMLDQAIRSGTVSNIPLLPVEAIRAAMLEPYLGSTFLDRFADARDEFVRLIRRSIVESQIRGESITQATLRLREALGIKPGDPRSLWARVEMIARTEILRASNDGALAIYEANQDVISGIEWLATKDERTCPICGALDSQQWTWSDTYPVPPAHVRCRCALTPVLIDQALEQAIVGPRQSYREWAAERGITIVNDGGTLRFRGAPPPKSNTDAAQNSAPHLYDN